MAAKRLFTVNGLVAITAFGICTTDVTGTGSIQLGIGDSTNVLIASTTGTAIDNGELWDDAIVTRSYDTMSDTVPLWLIAYNDHVVYEVTGNTLTGGVVTFYCLWEPISDHATVQSAGVNAAA